MHRALTRIVAIAAASAAAVMAVFAAGFALFALIVPMVGAAGAAAIVALVAALGVSLFALMVALRARQEERDVEVAQAQLADELPLGLSQFTRDRPLATLAVTAVAGILAARYPSLARDLLGVLGRLRR
jgi:hypothetical protein